MTDLGTSATQLNQVSQVLWQYYQTGTTQYTNDQILNTLNNIVANISVALKNMNSKQVAVLPQVTVGPGSGPGPKCQVSGWPSNITPQEVLEGYLRFNGFDKVTQYLRRDLGFITTLQRLGTNLPADAIDAESWIANDLSERQAEGILKAIVNAKELPDKFKDFNYVKSAGDITSYLWSSANVC